MAHLLSFLGKRSPTTQPLARAASDGCLPDAQDLPGPPPAKVAAITPDEQSVNLSELLEQVEARLSAKMARQNEQFATQLALVEKENSSLKGRVAQLEQKVATLERSKQPASPWTGAQARETKELSKQQADTEARVTGVQQQLELQDRQQRSSHVMVYNLPEDGRQTPLQQVSACLSAAGVPDRANILSAVRLGRPSQAPSTSTALSKPRPVKATFQAPTDVFNVLRASKRLRERRGITVDRDLTPAQRSIRKSLQPAVKTLRDAGFVTVWRGEQLFYIDKRENKRVLYTGQVPSTNSP